MHAGLEAIDFFETSNPEVPRFGCGGGIADNMAEWIVDLTTKARKQPRLSANSVSDHACCLDLKSMAILMSCIQAAQEH